MQSNLESGSLAFDLPPSLGELEGCNLAFDFGRNFHELVPNFCGRHDCVIVPRKSNSP